QPSTRAISLATDGFSAKTNAFILSFSFYFYNRFFQKHLLQPQFLQMLQPPSNTRGSPHSGQTIRSLGLVTALGLGIFRPGSAALRAASSCCTSLYISRRAFPTA